MEQENVKMQEVTENNIEIQFKKCYKGSKIVRCIFLSFLIVTIASAVLFL